jgi:hypothetical protein
MDFTAAGSVCGSIRKRVFAGSDTSSPGLAATQEKAESRVPILRYGVGYALNALVYALRGFVIAALVRKA